jgi:hypothetical protein
VSEAFFVPAGDDRFVATEHTVGPWDPRLQHGGPPAALLTRVVEALPGLTGPIIRLCVDIIGPVPVGELTVRAHVRRPGRSVELLEAELSAGGRPAARLSAWRVKEASLQLTAAEPREPAPDLPTEDAAEPDWPGGYLRAMQWRMTSGDWSTLGPATLWGRMRHPLVAGESPSPLCRVMILADCGNGASAALPHGGWLFINPDLTVHLAHPPAGEWYCLDAVTSLDPAGFGLAHSRLFDTTGLVGRGAQALYVARR